MNIYSIMESACAALVADTTLQAKAQTSYGKALSVFIDQDEDFPPQGDDATASLAPSIQLHSWFFEAAERSRDVTGGFEALITIADPDLATRADSAKVFVGTSDLDVIIRRAIIVLRSCKPSGLTIRVRYETDTITYFPAMMAGLTVEYGEVLAARQDPFA